MTKQFCPGILSETVILFGGCVEELNKVVVRVDDHDYNTIHTKFKTVATHWGNIFGLHVQRRRKSTQWSDLMSGVREVLLMLMCVCYELAHLES